MLYKENEIAFDEGEGLDTEEDEEGEDGAEPENRSKASHKKNLPRDFIGRRLHPFWTEDQMVGEDFSLTEVMIRRC